MYGDVNVSNILKKVNDFISECVVNAEIYIKECEELLQTKSIQDDAILIKIIDTMNSIVDLNFFFSNTSVFNTNFVRQKSLEFSSNSFKNDKTKKESKEKASSDFFKYKNIFELSERLKSASSQKTNNTTIPIKNFNNSANDVKIKDKRNHIFLNKKILKENVDLKCITKEIFEHEDIFNKYNKSIDSEYNKIKNKYKLDNKKIKADKKKISQALIVINSIYLHLNESKTHFTEIVSNFY